MTPTWVAKLWGFFTSHQMFKLTMYNMQIREHGRSLQSSSELLLKLKACCYTTYNL